MKKAMNKAECHKLSMRVLGDLEELCRLSEAGSNLAKENPARVSLVDLSCTLGESGVLSTLMGYANWVAEQNGEETRSHFLFRHLSKELVLAAEDPQLRQTHLEQPNEWVDAHAAIFKATMHLMFRRSQVLGLEPEEEEVLFWSMAESEDAQREFLEERLGVLKQAPPTKRKKVLTPSQKRRRAPATRLVRGLKRKRA